jgi:hypothetical protein
MILWLDHLLFGSGHGFGSPYFDQRFYWLTDGNANRHGELYTFNAWLGAQLHSVQWRHPKPGERRLLGGRTFVPFQSHRKLFRVYVSWAMTPHENLDEFARNLGRGP